MSLTPTGFGSTEILQIADAVAREKNIPRDYVLDAMENSVAIAARKKYGYDKNIKAEIDKKSGEIKLFREMDIVPDDYKPEVDGDEEAYEEALAEIGKTKIYLSDAKLKDAEAEVGGVIREQLPPIDLGRVAAQTAKQVIIQKVREAEKERQFGDYKDRVGEIINGVVKRVEFGNVIVELGNAEAVIRKEGAIRGENFKVNDRIRAYISNVERDNKGPQIILSRTAPQFMAKLFAQEVPEIYDGIIEVKAVAREPGSRAKIAVFSNDNSIDPIGSCVGVRGARVQAVINELQGEKIDIIQWSHDPATFLVNALAPAEVSKVVIDEDNRRIEAVVPDDQLSLAIGRRGQNVRLASELVGWRIDVMTEEKEAAKRSEEFNRLSKLFTEALNVEEMIAHLLVSEGFNSVEEIAYVELDELASIEGFDMDIANELQGRAKEYLAQKKEASDKALDKLGVAADLRNFDGLKDEVIIKLAENNVKTLNDLADLARDEFVEMIPDSGLDEDRIDELIMSARAICYNDNSGEAVAN